MTTIHTSTEASLTGPDMTRCGQPIEWNDRVGLTDDFKAAAAAALELLEFDVELCRWSVEDVHAAQFASWWTNQRQMLRRYLRTIITDESQSFVVHRRTDLGDGMVKCYVRVEGGEQS